VFVESTTGVMIANASIIDIYFYSVYVITLLVCFYLLYRNYKYRKDMGFFVHTIKRLTKSQIIAEFEHYKQRVMIHSVLRHIGVDQNGCISLERKIATKAADKINEKYGKTLIEVDYGINTDGEVDQFIKIHI